jgi:hypothetical protein
MESMLFSETLVLRTATGCHIPEDGILQEGPVFGGGRCCDCAVPSCRRTGVRRHLLQVTAMKEVLRVFAVLQRSLCVGFIEDKCPAGARSVLRRNTCGGCSVKPTSLPVEEQISFPNAQVFLQLANS